MPRTLAAAMAMPREACALVNACLELFPGAPASPAVLAMLLARVERKKFLTILDGHRIPHGFPDSVEIQLVGRKMNKLLVKVRPAVAPGDAEILTCVWEQTFDATTEGMLAAIVESRPALASLKRGFCESCCAAEPPRKRLKCANLQMCPDCVLARALGCRPL